MKIPRMDVSGTFGQFNMVGDFDMHALIFPMQFVFLRGTVPRRKPSTGMQRLGFSHILRVIQFLALHIREGHQISRHFVICGLYRRRPRHVNQPIGGLGLGEHLLLQLIITDFIKKWRWIANK